MGKSVKHLFPLWLHAIEDVRGWRPDFFWPLSMAELRDLEGVVLERYLHEARTASGDASLVMRIVSTWVFGRLVDWAAAVVVMQRLQQDHHGLLPFVGGADKVVGHESVDWNKIFSIGGPPAEELEDFRVYLVSPGALHQRRGLTVRNMLSRLRLQMRFSPEGMLGAGNVAVNANPDAFSYLASLGEAFVLCPIHRFFRNYSVQEIASHSLNRASLFVVESIVSLLDDIVSRFGVEPLEERQRRFFQSAVRWLVVLVELDLASARCKASFFREKRVFSGTGGNYFTRLLNAVAQEEGATVMGFQHGGGSSCIYFPKFALTELEFADEFVVYDEKEGEIYKKYSTIKKKTAIMKLVGGGTVSVLGTSKGASKPVADFSLLHTVMYVAPGYFPGRQGAQVIPDLVHLDLEIRIIEYFLQRGVKVIYKKRPKSREQDVEAILRNYFAGQSLFFEDRPFSHQEVMAGADWFVFSKAASTALYEAMKETDKPIVLFHPGIPKLQESFLEQGRIEFVALRQDARNRLVFDAEALDRQLNRSHPSPQ